MSDAKKPLRIFIAHAKGDSDAALVTLEASIAHALTAAFATRLVRVTLGRDDYLTHSARCGSWDAWARDVAIGIFPATREPRYHGLVVPGSHKAARIGAATQLMAITALGAGKPVLVWSEQAGLTVAKRVVKVSARDFKTGWEIS